MISISFLTLQENDAVELASILNEHRLLMFGTLENHVDLLWDGNTTERRHLTHLSGFTKALLYSTVENKAIEVLGDRLVRMWAQPVTNLDPKSTKQLMSSLAKA
ncbi:MAG: hypothetical protein ACI91R_001766 [Vicingaceae bacterium]|jgi:hypothetical protein|tara:strand:+ start:612 stop:923 length:312 start_codon:yes stop_codon:yes gene_type:complete